jgi:hypothetical protein
MMNDKGYIFGSTAIKYHFPEYNKNVNDTDILVSDGMVCDKIYNTEYHALPDIIYQYVIFLNKNNKYVSVDTLYTIICSHLAWDSKNGKWWKYLKDAIFLKNNGAKVHNVLFNMLYQFWCAKFGDKSHISLNKTTELFFSDKVDRKYNHDELHNYFKITDTPAYINMLKSSNSPLCPEDIFNSLPKEIQYYSVLEEMFVVSYERDIKLPNAFKSLVTKMSKGYWNRFMIENAELFLDGFVEEKKIYKSKSILANAWKVNQL